MRQLCYVVGMPLVATLLLSVLAMTTMSSSVPRDMGNSSQWTEFASEVSVRVSATDTPTRVAVLMGMHAMHLYVCLPMLHVTKVLYGFWLGVWLGWSVCFLWETALFYAYICTIYKERHEAIFAYTSNARLHGTLFRENALFAMSSLPLQASASVVQFGDVTCREFMAANALVTAATSLKNVACGAVLASSPSPHQLVVLASVLVFSTVLPTLATLYVSSKTVLMAFNARDENRALLRRDSIESLELSLEDFRGADADCELGHSEPGRADGESEPTHDANEPSPRSSEPSPDPKLPPDSSESPPGSSEPSPDPNPPPDNSEPPPECSEHGHTDGESSPENSEPGHTDG